MNINSIDVNMLCWDVQHLILKELGKRKFISHEYLPDGRELVIKPRKLFHFMKNYQMTRRLVLPFSGLCITGGIDRMHRRSTNILVRSRDGYIVCAYLFLKSQYSYDIYMYNNQIFYDFTHGAASHKDLSPTFIYSRRHAIRREYISQAEVVL